MTRIKFYIITVFRYVVIAIILLPMESLICTGQNNLVMNGDFEKYTCSPYTKDLMMQYRSHFVCFSRESKSVLYSVPSWSVPSSGTPDFYVDTNCRGSACAGILLTADEEYREFLQMKLSLPMIKDSVYNLSFYVNFSDKDERVPSKFNPPALGLIFDREKRGYDNIVFPRFQGNWIQLSLPNLSKGEWVKIEYNYLARGGERYITVGNFLRDQSIKGLEQLPLKDRMSYLLLDDFYIEKKSTSMDEIIITYDKGLHDLSDEDKRKILLNLNVIEKNDLKAKYTIISSASDDGSEQLNLMLSQKRAQTIKDLLIVLGVEEKNIVINTVGESINRRRSQIIIDYE